MPSDVEGDDGRLGDPQVELSAFLQLLQGHPAPTPSQLTGEVGRPRLKPFSGLKVFSVSNRHPEINMPSIDRRSEQKVNADLTGVHHAHADPHRPHYPDDLTPGDEARRGGAVARRDPAPPGVQAGVRSARRGGDEAPSPSRGRGCTR